jgi:hypothetical protein
MARFLERSRASFDFVVIDSPPIQAVADGLILGSQADGVILCVHGGKTSRDQVLRVRNRLLKSNVRILGVLLNQLEDSAVAYGTGKYGYGYGYYGRPEADVPAGREGKESGGRVVAACGSFTSFPPWRSDTADPAPPSSRCRGPSGSAAWSASSPRPMRLPAAASRCRSESPRRSPGRV